MLAQHHYEASSPAQCNHNLSLLDAGQLAHHISSKTCENHSTISMLHSKYFPHQYNLSGDYPSKPSTADTHHVQQLISSWKAGTAAQITKMLVDVKNKPLESYNIGFNLSQAELKAVWKKKGHFSASGIGGCSWSSLFHIKTQIYFLLHDLRQLTFVPYDNSTSSQSFMVEF